MVILMIDCSVRRDYSTKYQLRAGQTNRALSKRSLLNGFVDGWVEWEDDLNISHDPVLKKRKTDSGA